MHKPIKYVEKGLTYAARGAWVVFDALNSIKPNPSFTPDRCPSGENRAKT